MAKPARTSHAAINAQPPAQTATLPMFRLVANGEHLATLECNEDVTDREVVNCSLNTGKDGAVICEADADGFLFTARNAVAMSNGTRPRGFDFFRMTLEGKTTLQRALGALQIYRHSALRKV